jgi:mannosyltransferase OCH1-like enzyme/GR25 family glycosyltransferase involved in LPS biosynthesis
MGAKQTTLAKQKPIPKEKYSFKILKDNVVKYLTLKDDMILEDCNAKNKIGILNYNKNNDTFMILDFNGNTHVNMIKDTKVVYDEYKRNYIIEDMKDMNYDKLQNDFIEKRVSESVNGNDNPYNLYVLNLKEREDRRTEILQDLKDTKVFNIHFFESIKHPKGWMGCGLSHISIVKYAKNKNLPYIIVAEDDFQIKVSDDKLLEILNLLTSNLEDWDIFNGCPTFFEKQAKGETIKFYKPCKNLENDFIKVNWGQSASFIIYSATSYDKWLNFPFTSQSDINDQYLAKKFIQIAYKKELFSLQKSSYSNLSNGYRGKEYEQCFIDMFNVIKDKTSLEKVKNIGLYSIFIGEYTTYYEGFIRNCEDMLLPQYNKYYYIVTDKEDLPLYNNRTFIVKVDKIGWPYETLYRFKYFLMFHKDLVNKSDYIYFLNSNGRFTENINEEILPNNSGYTLTLHNGYEKKHYVDIPFEKQNKTSTAYIHFIRGNKYKYVAGGFLGAETKKFISLCKLLEDNITRDESNNHIAIWHDESHINHYYNILNRDCKLLDTSYHTDELKYIKGKTKLIFLSKQKTLKSSKNFKDCLQNRNGKVIKNKYNSLTFNNEKITQKLKGVLPYKFSIEFEKENLYDIPKKINFMWIFSKVPKKYIENVKLCQKINGSNYEIILWVDQPCDPIEGVNIKTVNYEEFINKDIVQRERDTGKGCLTDMTSYEIIYKEGGIYSDIDAVFMKPFDELFEKSFVSYDIDSWYNLCHGIFGFPKESKFIKYILDCIRENGDLHPEVKYPPSRTGPTFFTSCFVQYDDENIKMIDQNLTINKSLNGYCYQTNDAAWTK